MNLSFEYNWLAAIVLYPLSGKKPTSLNLEPLPLPNVYDGPVRKSNFFWGKIENILFDIS